MPEPRPEQQVPLRVVPDAVLDVIARRLVSTENLVVYANDDGEIRRVCVIPEQLPGVGPAELSVDYRHHFQEGPKDLDMVDFQYNQGETPIATMQFQFMPDGTYNLHHRYVQPEFRKKRCG